MRTTDLARIDADGFVWILGRADQAIIRGGFKVMPDDVRAALESHPAVQGAAVVGRPDPRLGETPVAMVELRVGSTADRDELLDFLQNTVGPLRDSHRDRDRRSDPPNPVGQARPAAPSGPTSRGMTSTGPTVAEVLRSQRRRGDAALLVCDDDRLSYDRCRPTLVGSWPVGSSHSASVRARMSDCSTPTGRSSSIAMLAAVLQERDAGAVAHVIGLPDADRGQIVAAVVATDSPAALDESAVLEALRSELSAYKIPRKFVTVRHSDLPMLSSGKIDIARLRELLEGA